MKKIAHFAIVLMVLIAAAPLSGCGAANQGEAIDSGRIELDVGAGIATVAEVTALQGGNAFTTADLPLAEGARLEYAVNRPGTSLPVAFNLKGPWKFTSGPDEATMTMTLSAKSDAPGEEEFPTASAVAGSSWTGDATGTEYVFEGKDAKAWLSFGRVTADGRIITHSSPSQALVFPMTVGDTWTDIYSELEENRTTAVTAENEVVARNDLSVPAGTFDAWLVQTRVTAKSRTGTTTTIDYSWYVPGIGRAAEIISMPGENHTPFKTAQYFYRLKSHN